MINKLKLVKTLALCATMPNVGTAKKATISKFPSCELDPIKNSTLFCNKHISDRFKITNEITNQIKINSENIKKRRSSCEEKISDTLEWKEGCIFDEENGQVYLPHGDNEYSASGLFHLSGTRALDYQTLKHTIEMQPVPEKFFMCDFAIAVAGNPNQRVSSGGDSESSRLGADAIKVVIKEDEVSLGSDRLQGAFLNQGQDECPNGKEFLVDINSFDDLSSEYKIKLSNNGKISVTFLVDKERKIATLTVANGKQKISSELPISEYYQILKFGNAMRLSASYFENHCYKTNISSMVQDCTNDMTNTDNSNQLNTNNESGDISITKNSEPKSQSFPEMVALSLLTGAAGGVVVIAIIFGCKSMINRIRPDRSSDPGHGDIEMRDLQTEEGMGVNNSSITPGSPGQTSSVTLPHNHGGAFGPSHPDGSRCYRRIDLGNGRYFWQEGVQVNSNVVGSGEEIPQTENSSGPAMRDARGSEFLEREGTVTQESPRTSATGLAREEIVSNTTDPQNSTNTTN